MPTEAQASRTDSAISSSVAVLKTAEGTGRDVDENGGDLNIYFSTSTYPPHISLTFYVVARSTAEVKSYDFGESYGQG